ncbi:FmdB family zinc ribbon protein [Geomicrobium sp. JCM 19038]|uniref:FmdB family zinc ribbon protein n=1 Tax=Geomicrobium sp. JCM 19038 TaxID=1460635 RepID=UPI001268437F
MIYSFTCPSCGPFEERHTSSHGDKTKSVCPVCTKPSKRIFKVPNTFTMNATVKRKVDQGATPTLTQKDQLQGTTRKQNKSTARPWQIG